MSVLAKETGMIWNNPHKHPNAKKPTIIKLPFHAALLFRLYTDFHNAQAARQLPITAVMVIANASRPNVANPLDNLPVFPDFDAQ